MLKKIFLVTHTHMDIGYTDQPLEVLDQQLVFLDSAIDLGLADSSYCWTIESAYLVRDYLRNRSAERCESLFSLLRSGQFELGAFEVQPLTELMTYTELLESVQFAVELGRREGFLVENALLSDIGGFSALLPSALSEQGVKYLTSGVGAFHVFLPWAPLPHLFYLEDPAGKQLLIWNLGIDRNSSPWEAKHLMAVYGMGSNLLVLPFLRYFSLGTDRAVELEGQKAESLEAPETAFRNFEERLKNENYPYEEIMLQCGGDNRWPPAFLAELVRKINQETDLPEIELTTASKFFHFMQKKYSPDIPVCKGVITDPWASRINPAPEPLKYYLAAQRRRQYIENLGANISEQFKENMALYADHTCGLSGWHIPELESNNAEANDPVFEALRISWRSKRRYAEFADAESINALRYLTNLNHKSDVSLFNHSNVEQSGIFELLFGRDLAPMLNLSLADGTALPWQQIGHQRYLVELRNIPAKSCNPLKLEVGEVPEYFVKETENLQELPESIQTDFFNFTIDKDSGDLLQVKNADNSKTYNEQALFELKVQLPKNFTQSWAKAGMTQLKESFFPNAKITRCGLRFDGPLCTCIEQRGNFADKLNYRLHFFIYKHFPFIDVDCFIDKAAHRDLISIYLSCQLSGTVKKWKIAQHGAVINPSKDLLPGAMKDLFYAPQGAWLKNEKFTALMQSMDAPILHPGKPYLFAWLSDRDFLQEPAEFHWNIYQNLPISDCPAWQKILNNFRFRLYLDVEEKFPPMPDSIQLKV